MAMDPDVLERVAQLSCGQILELLASKSSKHWLAVKTAFKDTDAGGEEIRDFCKSGKPLHAFLAEELELRVPKLVASQLCKMLSQKDGLADEPPTDAEAAEARARAEAAASAKTRAMECQAHEITQYQMTQLRAILRTADPVECMKTLGLHPYSKPYNPDLRYYLGHLDLYGRPRIIEYATKEALPSLQALERWKW